MDAHRALDHGHRVGGRRCWNCGRVVCLQSLQWKHDDLEVWAAANQPNLLLVRDSSSKVEVGHDGINTKEKNAVWEVAEKSGKEKAKEKTWEASKAWKQKGGGGWSSSGAASSNTQW